MPDCFISHSKRDLELAKVIWSELDRHGVRAFLAPADLQPGEEWTEVIWKNLRSAEWVIFLASREACQSGYVQQELGGALAGMKKVVPVVWDMDPSELPGWASRMQAIDLRGCPIHDLQSQIASVAERIRAKKQEGYVILGAVILGLLLLAQD